MGIVAKDAVMKEETARRSEVVANIDWIGMSGGPGSGKGTQCSKIAATYGFCHLSAEELLEKESQSGSEYGALIKALKADGKLVPSEIVIKLLQQAMEENKVKKFLIDGFPRNNENRTAAEKLMQIDPEFVLFFECSEEVMTRRLLNRNQGRADDNQETIQKRFRVYNESTLPVINYYSSKGKVHKIDAEQPVEEVFEAVKRLFFKLGWKVGE
ncbi:hypothetical protein RJ640_028191 [Escallonia rubra]|uniref:adenylate kinase n=1 Tax=Escallonia rubra TaxID=112253 RepID=A0AA88QL96_9ASTE|nr:hypothetical protein RJ640_028191 [Escallonia rubra]